MIKIALKHWIYEKCIDVLFEGICRNFAFLNRNMIPMPMWILEVYKDGTFLVPNTRSFRIFHRAFISHIQHVKDGIYINPIYIVDLEYFGHNVKDSIKICMSDFEEKPVE